jgi:hypothetical protein
MEADLEGEAPQRRLVQVLEQVGGADEDAGEALHALQHLVDLADLVVRSARRRLRRKLSASSSSSTAPARRSASSNMRAMFCSVSPTNLLAMSLAWRIISGRCSSAAMCSASAVLPVPGGPWKHSVPWPRRRSASTMRGTSKRLSTLQQVQPVAGGRRPRGALAGLPPERAVGLRQLAQDQRLDLLGRGLGPADQAGEAHRGADPAPASARALGEPAAKPSPTLTAERACHQPRRAPGGGDFSSRWYWKRRRNAGSICSMRLVIHTTGTGLVSRIWLTQALPLTLPSRPAHRRCPGGRSAARPRR